MAIIEQESTSKQFLPLDIVKVILLKLPVKSLQRFKTVCNLWNVTISDHDFTINHLQQSKNSKDRNIFLFEGTKLRDQAYRLVKFENNELQIEATPEQPYSGDLLLCYADGLTLLSLSDSTSYVLWNPSSKQQAIIPCPYRFYHGCASFGFCRGPTLDDYKIVAGSWTYYAVYSCKNKVWTAEKQCPYGVMLYNAEPGGLFVDGFSVWAIQNHSNIKWEIIYFDPRDEAFKKLQGPKEIKYDREFSLTSFKGCLCLYRTETCGTMRQLQIWMMLDGINVDSSTWTKLMIINYNVVHGPQQWNRFTSLLLTENNELVLCCGYGHSLFNIYNSTEEKFEEIDVPPSLNDLGFLNISPYLSSLFFPIQ